MVSRTEIQISFKKKINELKRVISVKDSEIYAQNIRIQAQERTITALKKKVKLFG